MTFLSLFRRAALLAVAASAALLLPAHCFADSYQIVSLGTDAAVGLYGIDSSGAVVLDKSAYCATACFDTYVDGVLMATSSTPDIVPDDGSPCDPATPADFTVEHAICNGNREAYTGYFDNQKITTAVFAGPGSSDLLAAGGEGPLLMNSAGDIVWDDHFTEQLFEAVDVTPSAAPEPSTWILMATASLAIFGLAQLRHRRSR
jgi:hypothetical protein